MSEISIRRRHGQTHAAARASAERLARELQEEFDLAYEWDDDCLRFTRSGVSGDLRLDDTEAELNIRLGFLLSALKPMIEREAHRFFDENFPA
ncbi:polyhydroxyalkanoic acid system family protein [Rhodocyclus tenuis]|uniref:Putative polyhydroxyalkanoate system protein n=1 Tax=Rhodocyclus tenuis TaxID=1066 RepID=A0A840G6V6_RHOTE|nr:polyhydroxyalkanoic acid system family protein [Rhodocyclus tenuis]MBB4248093.1 putative polyhydroxyalkanoate system protein [Rhodocyclus tenuis]MBK1679416.1 hypothetical protein [Rhodocyclus tenuis]